MSQYTCTVCNAPIELSTAEELELFGEDVGEAEEMMIVCGDCAPAIDALLRATFVEGGDTVQ